MRIYKIRRYGVEVASDGVYIAAHNFRDACVVAGPGVIECCEVGKLVNADVAAMRDFLVCIEELGEDKDGDYSGENPQIISKPVMRCICHIFGDQCTNDALPSSNFCFTHQNRRP